MSASSDAKTAATIEGSRSWLEDDRATTVEAEQARWEEVKRGSDELLAYYWSSYGKWGYTALATACLGGGAFLGYKKGQEKGLDGIPATRPVKMMAVKALAAGTALCASITGLIVGSTVYYYDIKSLSDFQTRMRLFVPSIISPVPQAIEKLGLKTNTGAAGQSMDYETGSIDQTMKEAFGKSDYYANFKPDDYKHQTASDSKSL